MPAIGRAYRIKKSELKGYGYTKPPSKRRAGIKSGRGLRPNASVTHIAAINGRGSYAKSRSARSKMSGLSANARRRVAKSSLSSAKKRAFANSMRSLKRNSSVRPRSSSINSRASRPASRSVGYRVSKLRANGAKRKIGTPARRAELLRSMRRVRRPDELPGSAAARARKRNLAKARKKRKSATKSRRKSATTKTRKKTTMARKVRRTRRKAGSGRKRLKRNKGTRAGALKGWRKRRAKSRKSTAAKPRKKRRKVSKTKRRVSARKAPKRKKRRAKAKLKANPRRRRRLRRNSGTSRGARKGWKTRRRAKSARKAPKRRRRSKAKRTVKRKRKYVRRGRKGTRNLRPKRRLKANRRRRSSRRRLSSNRRRRSSRKSYRSNKRRALSPNRRRRSSSRKRRSSKRRRSMRRNGTRKFFRKNGVTDTLKFIAVTGGLALGGLVTHKLATNLLTKYVFNKFLGSPATVVATTSGQAIVATPATSGLGALNIDPSYQKLGASAIVAIAGILAAGKLIKNPNTRNAAMTGIAVSFAHTIFQTVASKFFPQYADMLSGADDGTAARLSAMYGLGSSIMPRYAPINGVGEYFQSTSGLGEYFQGTAGLGEYFQGTSGLGALPAYEAAAGMGSYSGNPDLMEAAAGMGQSYASNTDHVDPHGNLDRELNIAEAAAGVGALPAYEASAGFGNVSTVPSTSTWIPGSSNGQIWAGTRSISNNQSATEMVPAGILQTDGGQGVFG